MPSERPNVQIANCAVKRALQVIQLRPRPLLHCTQVRRTATARQDQIRHPPTPLIDVTVGDQPALMTDVNVVANAAHSRHVAQVVHTLPQLLHFIALPANRKLKRMRSVKRRCQATIVFSLVSILACSLTGKPSCSLNLVSWHGV